MISQLLLFFIDKDIFNIDIGRYFIELQRSVKTTYLNMFSLELVNCRAGKNRLLCFYFYASNLIRFTLAWLCLLLYYKTSEMYE